MEKERGIKDGKVWKVNKEDEFIRQLG